MTQILVLTAFLVGGALLDKARLAPPPKVTDLVLKVVLWALLFVMGFRLGNERELRERLGEMGLLALGTAVATLAGTVLAIAAAYAVLDALRSRRARRADAVPAASGAAPDTVPGDAPAAPGAAGGKPRLGLAHFKGPATLLLVVVIGFAAGLVLPPAGFDYGTVTGWVLNALLFMIGVQFSQSRVSLRSAFVRADTIVVPAATIVGTLAGGLAVALIFGVSAGKALSLAAGFGWYSLSGVLIADLGDPALGSAAFLANMMRESLALVLIPLLAATKRPYTAIGAGGATAMDVTLPLLERCLGPDAVPVCFSSGVVLSVIVPVLVPLFYRLG